jgi:hypothetical protein
MTNQEYDLPDLVEKTSYRCYYLHDRDSYLPYLGWSIDLHTKFSKSQFLMMISPISSDLCLSCAQLYHHLRTRSSVIPLYLSMP